jgi:hypothetical protein
MREERGAHVMSISRETATEMWRVMVWWHEANGKGRLGILNPQIQYRKGSSHKAAEFT